MAKIFKEFATSFIALEDLVSDFDLQEDGELCNEEYRTAHCCCPEQIRFGLRQFHKVSAFCESCVPARSIFALVALGHTKLFFSFWSSSL